MLLEVGVVEEEGEGGEEAGERGEEEVVVEGKRFERESCWFTEGIFEVEVEIEVEWGLTGLSVIIVSSSFS